MLGGYPPPVQPGLTGSPARRRAAELTTAWLERMVDALPQRTTPIIGLDNVNFGPDPDHLREDDSAVGKYNLYAGYPTS